MNNDLLDAVAANDLDLISSILNQYDDPGSSELQSLLNQQDPTTGNTLAHIAALHSSKDCLGLALLIEYDVDVSRKNWDGLTPLGVANMNGRVEAAKLIKNNYIFDTTHQERKNGTAAAISSVYDKPSVGPRSPVVSTLALCHLDH